MALLALMINYIHVYASLDRSFLRVYTIERAYACAYIYMHMHLYPREFAFVYTQKRKCSFLRAYMCICVRAFVCVSSHGFN